MTITYRPGSLADSYFAFNVFLKSIMDYGERMGVQAITGGNDPEMLDSLWENRKPIFDFLAEHASQFWLAEENGEVIGYARAFEHDGHHELTEFFVKPGRQSRGVGGELLSRAFPDGGAPYRSIIALLDERALARYLKLGVYGRGMLKYFSRKAERVDIPTDLLIQPLDVNLHADALNRIDRDLLSHTRLDIHRWLASQRAGFIYQRGGDVVGYGYIGGSHGPFAVLDDADFPAILAHAETRTAEQGGDFGVSVPLSNKKALDYLLSRNYQIDSFSALLMTNVPFGKLENYLTFAPEFFL